MIRSEVVSTRITCRRGVGEGSREGGDDEVAVSKGGGPGERGVRRDEEAEEAG